MIHYAHANAVGVALKDERGVHFVSYAPKHHHRRPVPVRPVETDRAYVPPAKPLPNAALPASFNSLLLLPPLLG